MVLPLTLLAVAGALATGTSPSLPATLAAVVLALAGLLTAIGRLTSDPLVVAVADDQGRST